ncbi:hypothetical protein H2248_001958 [Termitomyces sp. 'cryptogamus']|nr:hypothetical protein H2248_001958 [Termitomyces sp. 'cryptogamus']
MINKLLPLFLLVGGSALAKPLEARGQSYRVRIYFNDQAELAVIAFVVGSRLHLEDAHSLFHSRRPIQQPRRGLQALERRQSPLL